MAMVLDAKLGQSLTEELLSIVNGDYANAIEVLREACKKIGDNHLVEGVKTKFNNAYEYFNSTFLPLSAAVRDELNAYTDLSNYVANLEQDTNVTQDDVGHLETGVFDAAKAL